jgi:hypothetical protein
MAMALKKMYDLYGEVAGQLSDLIRWVQEGQVH